MDDFLKKRQNAIQNIPEKTINDWVEKMLRYLGGEVWLKKSKNVNHPIVKLWGRKDAMATNELVNFAYAVTVMEGIDPKWTAQTMKIVAGRDYNNAHGAIFEILALSAFAEGGCEVIPAPVGCPGIDGTLRFGDSTVNLSLKYYGMSNAESNFRALMDNANRAFVKELCKTGKLSAQIMLSMKRYADTPKEKEAVIKAVREAVALYGERACITTLESDICNIIMRPIGLYRLAETERSHVFVATSPLHKNEYKNLSDKIDDARENLERYRPEQSDSEYNGVVVHLHESADIDAYQKDVQSYFNSRPDIPISFVMLYQALITSDEKNETTSVTHIIKPVFSVERVIKPKGPRPVPHIEFFLGNGTDEPPKKLLCADGRSIVELKNVYYYQKGEIFQQAEVFSDGSIGGTLSSLSPGIKLSAVMPPIGPKHQRLTIRPITNELPHLEIT